MKAVSLSFFLRTRRKKSAASIHFSIDRNGVRGVYSVYALFALSEAHLENLLRGGVMTIQIGKWELELGLRRVRPLVGGNLDLQADLAAAYAKIGRPRRRKRSAK
jgi:hypothetical protein